MDDQKQQIDDQVKQPEGFDLFQWWTNHHTRFPHLVIAVKNLLCIPTTSANFERAFSTLTEVVTRKRNKLKGETTHILSFLKHSLGLIPAYTTNIARTESQEDNKPSTSEENYQEMKMKISLKLVNGNIIHQCHSHVHFMVLTSEKHTGEKTISMHFG